MKLSLAVAGKGGTGKTTFSALLVRSFKEKGIGPILAVDADPNSNLAEALGTEPGRPLAEIREVSSTSEGSPPGGLGRARSVDDEIQRAIAEADGFDLITMGRGEGPRCYCYVNTLLRKSLSSLSANYNLVVLDNEAGMEHLSRRTTDNVDVLIGLLNPTLPSLRAAERIVALSRELPVQIGRRVVLVNRVGPAGTGEQIDRKLELLDAQRLLDIPQDDALEQLGAIAGDVFSLPNDNPALAAVRNVVFGLLGG